MGLFGGCGVVSKTVLMSKRIRLHILGVDKSYVLKKYYLFDNAKAIMPFAMRNLYYVIDGMIDGSEELIDINRSYKYYITLLYAFSTNKLFVIYVKDGEILYDTYNLVKNSNIYEFHGVDIIANCNFLSVIDSRVFDKVVDKDSLVYALYCLDNPIAKSRLIVILANRDNVVVLLYEEVT